MTIFGKGELRKLDDMERGLSYKKYRIYPRATTIVLQKEIFSGKQQLVLFDNIWRDIMHVKHAKI